jgi:hypothetical protein
VTVDLLRGIAVAPHERARIVGIGIVHGGRGTNHLIGGTTPGTWLWGGPGRNYLASNLPGTQMSMLGPHRPSTVLCGDDGHVYGLESSDLALGGCRTENPVLQMLLPLKRLSSPVIELPHASAYREATLRALPGGTVIGHVSVPPIAPATSYCYLSPAGRAQVRRAGHLLVGVEAVLVPPLGVQSRILSFRTVIRRP